MKASFTDLRAQGAFLVSASWSGGCVTSVSVLSEAGETCRFYSPWAEGMQVTDGDDKKMRPKVEKNGTMSFDTQAGHTYVISCPTFERASRAFSAPIAPQGDDR